APVSMSNAPRYREWLKAISRKFDVDLVMGYIDHTFTDRGWVSYNSAGLFDNEGRHTAQYNKVNLLPFGERIPFSQYITALGRLNFGQANFEAGRLQPLFHSRAGRFGVLICFESAFSFYSRQYVLEGARFLVNITNDGWFGSRRGPIQHAELAILRAVENRVTLLRSANTGISMIVDPVGRVCRRIDLDKEGIILGQIHPAGKLSFYCRHGHMTFFIMALISLAVVPLLSILPHRS
ncbi:MAG: apolipoprotein N-acyltransferase, partial [Candidatus Krumholzibacteria bacterium]|nr:apolipoprotein N-acyltransferase [Candidatus Krumholzibacteria bacterium]